MLYINQIEFIFLLILLRIIIIDCKFKNTNLEYSTLSNFDKFDIILIFLK